MIVVVSIPAVVVIWGAVKIINSPIVYTSWSEQECVLVISPDPSHSCENKPERYYGRWSR